MWSLLLSPQTNADECHDLTTIRQILTFPTPCLKRNKQPYSLRPGAMRSMDMDNTSDPVLVEGCRVRLKSAPWVIMTVRSVLPVSTDEPEDEAPSRRRYVVEWQEKDGLREGMTQERNLAREELELVPESEWETLKQEVPTAPDAGA
ncbi:MAG: hypothetical protein JWO08_4318 [Verrucomicrobiaceae bacterium]|nr:hypothetical protein [Verrucomicrobiaceae bacterium]